MKLATLCLLLLLHHLIHTAQCSPQVINHLPANKIQSLTIGPNAWHTIEIPLSAHYCYTIVMTSFSTDTVLQTYGRMRYKPTQVHYDQLMRIRHGTNLFEESFAYSGLYYLSVYNPSDGEVHVEMILLVNGENATRRTLDQMKMAFGVVLAVVTVMVLRWHMNRMLQGDGSAAASSAGQEDHDFVLPDIPTFNRKPVPLMKMSNGPWNTEQYVPHHMQPEAAINNNKFVIQN